MISLRGQTPYLFKTAKKKQPLQEYSKNRDLSDTLRKQRKRTGYPRNGTVRDYNYGTMIYGIIGTLSICY